MQHFKEFLIRIQTFNLRINKQDLIVKDGLKNEKQPMNAYSITHETQYYDSFSYKSELRVLKDMALIDLVVLDNDHINLELLQLKKVMDRFDLLWENYHQNYSGYEQVYKTGYPFSIKLDSLFIVNNLQSDDADVMVTPDFVDDLSDSIKLRESFLKDLVKEAELLVNKKAKTEVPPSDIQLTQPVIKYPSFTDGAADQFFSILKSYFDPKDHSKLSALLFGNTEPESPLIFKGNGNQLGDAFKQLFDDNLIVGCLQSDLEKWIAPKFLYLSQQGEPREFTEGYLNGIISTKTRPCKSPILKIEQKDGKFSILPVPRNKK